MGVGKCWCDRIKFKQRSVSVNGAKCIERINRHLNPSLHPHAAYFRRPLTVMGNHSISVMTWSEERSFEFTLSSLTEWDDCVLWQTGEDVSEHRAAYVFPRLEKFLRHIRRYLPICTTSQFWRPSSCWGLCPSVMLRRVGWQLPTFRDNISVSSSRFKQTKVILGLPVFLYLVCLLQRYIEL
jgi:hypothetical protein